jgi:hypothetical protein
MNPDSTTRASGQSSSSMPVPTKTQDKTALISPSRPSSNRSEIASTSDVCREITRPEVYDSWKDTGSRSTCANSRRRSSSTTAWPKRPVSVTNVLVAAACTRTAPAKTAAIRSSGTGSPDLTSGGMPLSIAMPISHGPASEVSEEMMMAAAVSATVLRCGRSRSPSSRRLRFRSSASIGADSSSAVSAATPRQDRGSRSRRSWSCLPRCLLPPPSRAASRPESPGPAPSRPVPF